MSLWFDGFTHLHIYVSVPPLCESACLLSMFGSLQRDGLSLNLAALSRTGRIKSSFVAEQQVLRGRKCQFCLLAVESPPSDAVFYFLRSLVAQSRCSP